MKATKRILETIATFGEDICNYAFNENERGNGCNSIGWDCMTILKQTTHNKNDRDANTLGNRLIDAGRYLNLKTK